MSNSPSLSLSPFSFLTVLHSLTISLLYIVSMSLTLSLCLLSLFPASLSFSPLSLSPCVSFCLSLRLYIFLPSPSLYFLSISLSLVCLNSLSHSLSNLFPQLYLSPLSLHISFSHVSPLSLELFVETFFKEFCHFSNSQETGR